MSDVQLTPPGPSANHYNRVLPPSTQTCILPLHSKSIRLLKIAKYIGRLSVPSTQTGAAVCMFDHSPVQTPFPHCTSVEVLGPRPQFLVIGDTSEQTFIIYPMDKCLGENTL